MDFDASDLATYTNKQASELLSNALSRLGYEELGFEGYSQAYSELGKKFWVKANTVKNDRDSFDPHYDNARAGWHQAETLKRGLQRIKDYTDQITDEELISVSHNIQELDWLPDLKKIFEESKAASASDNQLVSYFELSETEVTQLRQFLESSAGLEIVSFSSSALAVRTKNRRQSSIINFAHIPRILGALEYLRAAKAYVDNFVKVRERLLAKASAQNPEINEGTRQGVDQKLFDHLKSVNPNQWIKDELYSEFKSFFPTIVFVRT